MRKRVFCAAVAASLCAGMFAGEAEAADGTKITFATATWVGAGPFYIAQEKGFYEEQGLDVDLKTVDDESSYGSIMGSGAVDALGQVLDRLVINKASGVDETVVMSFDQSSGGDGIIASQEIQSVADLKGKTVALDKSTTSYFFFLTALADAGVDEGDIEIKDMNADSAGTSFVQGDVDAAVTWEPWLTNASTREGGHLLCSSADYPNTIVDAVAFSDSFIEENPDAVKGFVKAWNEAVDWYNDGSQEEGNQIMAKGLGIELDDFEDQVKGVTFYDQDANTIFFSQSEKENVYTVTQTAIDLWADRGIIGEAFDSGDMITGDFLEQ